MQQSSRSNFVRGALYGLSAVIIWAAFIVVSRLGSSQSKLVILLNHCTKIRKTKNEI